MKEEAKIIKLLKDFKQDPEKKLVSIFDNEFYQFSVDTDNKNNYDKKRLIRYIFKKFLNFVIWDQHFEKINWEIPFKYRGIKAALTHQKFGFYIYIDKKITRDEAENLSSEINLLIDRVLKLIEPIVRQEGITSLRNGEVIIENKLHELEDEFNFFHNEILRKVKKTYTSKRMSLLTIYRRKQEPKYLLNAETISFFSLLEHICVLGLAFTNAPERFDFEKFSKLKWQDKFKIVFPIEDPEFSSYYNQFIDVIKYRRNPAAHGHLDKAYTIFHFYLPEARHRIPMGLYDRELVYRIKYNVNINLLKSFLKFIRTNKSTKKWMWYLDRGFDVYYEKNELNEYTKYMKMSDRKAKEYLFALLRIRDDLGNMDW